MDIRPKLQAIERKFLDIRGGRGPGRPRTPGRFRTWEETKLNWARRGSTAYHVCHQRRRGPPEGRRPGDLELAGGGAERLEPQIENFEKG